MWGSMQVCLSTCWLLRNLKCRQAKLVGSIMAPHFRDLFWARGSLIKHGGTPFLDLTAKQWVRQQLCAILRPEQHLPMVEACVYGWLQQGFAYIGFATRARERHRHS
eukprot:653775-Pyramimonas_sp.AAC.1